MFAGMFGKFSTIPASRGSLKSSQLPRPKIHQPFETPRVVMTSEPDDNELVQGCLDGDERAFEILLLRYQGPVVNAVLRRVRQRDEATDLTQTAFVKAYEQLKTFDPSHKFFSWLYRIAINEAINFLKRRGKLEPLEGEWAGSARSPED